MAEVARMAEEEIDKERLKALLRELLPELMAEGIVKTIKGGDHTYYLTNDRLHIAAATPRIQLEGTETGGKNLSIRENAGKIDLYDEAGAAVLAFLANTAKTVFTVPIPIPDSQQSGLAADSTGVKWTSAFKLKIDPTNLKSAVIRATWTASHTDSVTAIEVYDETAGSVLGSVSGNTGTNAEGSVSGFTAGNIVTVRLSVTTASATTGATTSLTYAVLELTYGSE